MTEKTEYVPYILGVDLGVQSIGWAVIDLDEQDEPRAVRVAGIRCFDSGVGSEKEIELGTDESANAKRREARQHRRQLWRRGRRHAKLLRMLQATGLLPSGAVKSPQQRHELLLELDAQLAAQQNFPDDRIAAHVLPYRLRAKSLDEPLEPHALGRALYHLAQRRGFLSNKKAQKDEKEEGKVKAGIVQLQEEIEDAGARTLGEYFAKLDPEETRIRKRWTARRMYQDEFEAIYAAQLPHHSFLTDELKQRLYQAIFYQRPLKSQKDLIGKCDLERGRRRAPTASLAFQRFRFLQKLNDLEISDVDGEIRPLSNQERARLLEVFDTTAEFTFGGIRKLLGYRRPRGTEYVYAFNLEQGGEKKIVGNRTGAKMAKILGGRWLEMPSSQREALVQEILSFEKEDALARRLTKAWGLDEPTAERVAAVNLEQGYCALSRKAIAKLLPRLESGERLNAIRKELYGAQLAARRSHDALPPVLDAAAALRNPVVCRALTELRKVVNALIHRYGKPTKVRIELARDMKRSRDAREDASRRMRQNEKLREDAKKKIFDEINDDNPSRTDVLKVLLADECNWECPYTGRSISPQALLGRSPQFDIEHILPFSRSLDNSYMNKTLCYHQENRDVKRNRTPWEAYSGDEQKWNEIVSRVRRFRSNGAHVKLRRFKMTEIPEDFATRQLNDTRYISRLAADYVGLLFGGRIDAEGAQRVQVSTGAATAYLRDEWGLNAILSDGPGKNRDDHRHHAVDAVAIALASPATVRLLSHAAQEASQRGNRLFVTLDAPWDYFVDQVRRAVEAINVSYRIDRRVGGALHEETLYSKPYRATDKHGKVVEYRHVRKPLQNMSPGEIENIVDDRIRRVVQTKLEQLGGKPKKAFADANDHPYLRASDGRIIPIHKARFRPAVSTIPVGTGARRRYVAPGKNHHMEILAVLDEDGSQKRWEGKVVSVYEAAQRLREHKPAICRDHAKGKKFLFSLANNEYVQMEHEPGRIGLYRVVTISGSQVEFRLHTDARPSTILRQREHSAGRVRRNCDSLRRANARKVAVDPLGNVIPASD